MNEGFIERAYAEGLRANRIDASPPDEPPQKRWALATIERMTSLYFAVPSHSNTVTVETASTMLGFVLLASQRGLPVYPVFHSASLISHLRNTIVADFLASDHTHLFMLDADQGLPPELIFKLLDCGHPVAGALYPRRNFHWQHFDPSSVQAPNQLLQQGLRFVGEVLPDANGQISIVNGMTRARTLGTGAFMVQRGAIEKLIAHYPELHGQGFPDEDENLPRAKNNWGFFNPLTKAQDGVNAGEDIGFCKRWRDCGGELWADIATSNAHIGRMAFQGNYLQTMQAIGGIQT